MELSRHKETDDGLRIIHIFEYPCGHQFNQAQNCPVCSSIRVSEMWETFGESMRAKIELRDRMLGECKEVFANLIGFDTISPEVKHELYSLMLKLDEISKGMVNGKKTD